MFRFTMILMMLGLVAGCGLFGANAPTQRETAGVVYDGALAALDFLDEKLTVYVEEHPNMTQSQKDRVNLCAERLDRATDYLKAASGYFNENQDQMPGFKQNLGMAAKLLKLVVEDSRDIGVEIPNKITQLLDLAIIYSGV